MSRPAGQHLFLLGAGILILLITAVAAAPWLAPNDPLRIDLLQRFRPPGTDYLFGTDHLGRCVFSRILHGGRYSLGTGLTASALALALGAIVGFAAGCGRRYLDRFLQALTDIGLAFPGILLALVLLGACGPSFTTILIGIVGSSWPWWSRLCRDVAVGAHAREFVQAGMVIGVSGWRLWRGYILPQVLPPVIVGFSLKTGWIVLAVSGLGYLGLGIHPPTPEWGVMLHEARIYMNQAPWLVLFPGLALTLSVLACNLMAEGLRDLLQVKQ